MNILQAQDEQCADHPIPQDALSTLPASRDTSQEEISAFLGKGVHLTGTITYQGTIQIDGAFDGEIKTDGVVLIGESAVLKANVTAGTIVSKGTITGDIYAKEKLILQTPSVIVGDVTASVLSIEEGALIDGNLKMEEDTRKLKHKSVPRAVRSSAQFAARRMAI